MNAKKNWPITEIKPDGNPGWNGGAYTIAFVYSNRGNFIVKGFYREVRNHMRTLTDGGLKWFGNFTLWHHYMGDSGHRSIWKFWNDRTYIHEPSKSFHTSKWSSKWKVVKYDGEYSDTKTVAKLEFKRLPQRWIPEFDKL
jgi:hypothetical protein